MNITKEQLALIKDDLELETSRAEFLEANARYLRLVVKRAKTIAETTKKPEHQKLVSQYEELLNLTNLWAIDARSNVTVAEDELAQIIAQQGPLDKRPARVIH